MKRLMILGIFILGILLFSIVVSTGLLDAKSCTCLDMAEVKGACAFESEYVSHRITSSSCDYNMCDATVEVTCRDTDDGGLYTRTANSWEDCPRDCSGSGDPWDDWWDDLI